MPINEEVHAQLEDVIPPLSQSMREHIIENKAIASAQGEVQITTIKSSTSSLLAPPSVHFLSPLAPHQVFGFAPYWNLSMWDQFPLQSYSEISYFSLSVNGDGSISTGDSGWSGFQSPDLVSLISRAHSYGDRVFLTVSALAQSTLVSLASTPNAPNLLSDQLIPLVEAKGFDGVNIDFEGQGSGIRSGLTRLITTLSTNLHATNPKWQVSVDTYASSAADPFGPFDIEGLNPSVDFFFIMAYDMENPDIPSPNAPLSNWSPSDVEALAQYSAVVAPSKIILGIPLYGYDWTTSDGSSQALATGSPTALTFATIVANNTPQYWDQVSSTPWSSYKIGSQWHETYFDDPASIALKVALASYFKVAGVGVWALGMDGNSPQILSALLGNSIPVKDSLAGPTTLINVTTPTAPSPDPPTCPTTTVKPSSSTTQPIQSTLGGNTTVSTTDPTTITTSSSNVTSTTKVVSSNSTTQGLVTTFNVGSSSIPIQGGSSTISTSTIASPSTSIILPTSTTQICAATSTSGKN